LFDYPMLPTPNNFFSSLARDILKVQRCIASWCVCTPLHGNLRSSIVRGTPAKQVESVVSSFFDAVHIDKSKRDASNDLFVTDDFLLSCLRSAGLDAAAAAAVLEGSKSEAAKKLLADSTNEALELGAYGSPTMRLHFGPPFVSDGPWLVFGSDRFEQIARTCGLPYPGVGAKPLTPYPGAKM